MSPRAVRKLQDRVATALSPHTAAVANCTIHTLAQFAGGSTNALSEAQVCSLLAHFDLNANGDWSRHG